MENQIHTSLEVRYHEPERLPASAGIKWITDAFGIFKLHPWKWMGVLSIYLIVDLVVSIVDFLEINVLSSLKNIVFGWVGLCLLGGTMYAAKNADNGKAFDVECFFVVFQDKKISFFILFLVQTLFAIVGDFFIISLYFLGHWAVILSTVLFTSITLFVFLLTPALIVLDGLNPWEAIKANVKSTMCNIPSMIVYIGSVALFSSMWINLGNMLLSIFKHWIVIIILFLPVVTILLLSPYIAYRSIYPNGRIVKS